MGLIADKLSSSRAKSPSLFGGVSKEEEKLLTAIEEKGVVPEEPPKLSNIASLIENLRRGEFAGTALAESVIEEGPKAFIPGTDAFRRKQEAVRAGLKKEKRVSGRELLEKSETLKEGLGVADTQQRTLSSLLNQEFDVLGKKIKVPLGGPGGQILKAATALNITPGSVAGFGVETLLDPVTYIPFGLPVKAAGKLAKSLGVLAKTKGLGTIEKLSPAASNAIDSAFKSAGKKKEDFLNFIDPKRGAQKVGAGEISQQFEEALQAAPEKARRDLIEIFGNEKAIRTLPKAQQVQLNTALQQARDVSSEKFRGILGDLKTSQKVQIEELRGAVGTRIKERQAGRLEEANKTIDELKRLSLKRKEIPPTFKKLGVHARKFDSKEKFLNSLIVRSEKGGPLSVKLTEGGPEIARVGKRTDLSDLFDVAKESVKKPLPLKSFIKQRDVQRGIIKRQFKKETVNLKEQIKLLKDQPLEPLAFNRLKPELEPIFEASIKGLPENLQKTAKNIRDALDVRGQREFEVGALATREFNYFPRSVEDPRVLSGFQFVKSLFKGKEARAGFKKEAKIKSFSEFKRIVEKEGGEVLEDPVAILYDRMVKGYQEEAKQIMLKSVENKFVERIPREVKDYIDFLYNPLSSQQGLGKISAIYSKALNYTKGLLTSVNPAFYGRNLLGYPFIGATSAGLKAFNPKNFADAIVLKTTNGAISRNVGGFVEKVSHADFIKSMVDSNLIGSSFTRGDIKVSSDFLFRRFKPADPRRWFAEAFNMAQEVEDFGRLANAVHHWRQGKSLVDASRIAKDTLFNYSDLNRIDRAIQGIFGFYTFKRKNFPKQVMNLLNDPKQYALFSRSLDTISEGRTLTPDERDLLSDFDQKSLFWVGEITNGVREMRRLGFFPLEEAGQTLEPLEKIVQGDIAGGAADVASLINPIAKPFAEIATGKQFFFDRELKDIRRLPKHYNQLPDTAVNLINKAVSAFDWQPLERTQVPIIKNGQRTGESREVLQGDWRTIHLLTSLPINRTLVDVLRLSDENDVLRYFTGIAKTELDPSKAKFFKDLRRKKFIEKQAVDVGAAREKKIVFVPKKESRLPIQTKGGVISGALKRLR